MTTETDLPSRPRPPATSLRYTAGTDIGLRREENQDAFGIIENENFRVYLVADGMGGVRGGAIASSLAISTLRELLGNLRSPSRSDLIEAFEEANRRIFIGGVRDEALSGMGTTLVALVFMDAELFVVHVGDSRAYRIRGRTITPLTEDHTLVMELLRAGTISQEQVDGHPVAHMLTRSLGPSESVQAELTKVESGPFRGDRYLICSDGLYNHVKPNEIRQIVAESSIDDATQKLINTANAYGGSDNITIVLVEAGEGYPPPPFDPAESEAAEREAAERKAAEKAIAEREAIERKAASKAAAAKIAAAKRFKKNPDAAGSSAGEAAEQDVRTDDVADAAQPEPEIIGSPDASGSNFILRGGVAITSTRAARDEASSSEKPAEVSPEEAAPELTRQGEPQAKQKLVDPSAAAQSSSNVSAAGSAASDRAAAAEAPLILDRRWLVAGVLAGFFVGGVSAMLLSLHNGSENRAAASAVAPAANNIAMIEPLGGDAKSDGGISSADRMSPITGAVENRPGSSVAGVSGALSGIEAHNIRDRRENVIAQLAEIDQRLDLFKSLDPQRVEALRVTLAQERERVETQLNQVREDLDTATRRLAVWHGRRSRLETGDPTVIASEVAVSSDEVRKAKEDFERASWNYLKEVEVLRYKPADKQLGQNVQDLMRVRNQRMSELLTVVRRAVVAAISEVDGHISSLTMERELMQEELRRLEERNMLYATLLTGDQAAIDEQHALLNRERGVLKGELAELESLLPGIGPSAGPSSGQKKDAAAARSAAENSPSVSLLARPGVANSSK